MADATTRRPRPRPRRHDHDHAATTTTTTPPSTLAARRERRLLVVLVLNLVIVVAQAVVGLVAHSLGLVADAGHSLTDVAAVAVSLYAVRLARRPATLRRSYGFHRSTVLAAQANAAALLAVTGLIAYFGVRGLLHPPDVEGGWVLAAAVVSAVVNGAAAWMLGHGHHHDLNMRSAALHMVGDAATSASVAVTAVVILVTGGYHWLDPAVSLLIAALIAVQAVRLVGETTDMLLESTPPGLIVDDLIEAIVGLGLGRRRPRRPRLEPVARRAGRLRPPRPVRPAVAGRRPGGGPGGQGGHRRAVLHHPRHLRAGVRALRRPRHRPLLPGGSGVLQGLDRPRGSPASRTAQSRRRRLRRLGPGARLRRFPDGYVIVRGQMARDASGRRT